jgi:hypothetical protein
MIMPGDYVRTHTNIGCRVLAREAYTLVILHLERGAEYQLGKQHVEVVDETDVSPWPQAQEQLKIFRWLPEQLHL